MIDFDHFDALTFDCYGTLIDWETGIMSALAILLDGAEDVPSGDRLLELFGEFESEAERGPFRSYREVLTTVAHRLGKHLGVEIADDAASAFAGSVRAWPPFSDTVAALTAFATTYRVAIVSNVDDDLFSGSAALLQTDFSVVVTAQQVESYKPDPAHFEEVLRRLALPVDRVLHVAQSLYHDIQPAREMGLSSVWVNRRAGRLGGGATPASSAIPDLEVPDLTTLVRLMELGLPLAGPASSP